MVKKEESFSIADKLAQLEKIEAYFDQADLSSIDEAMKKHAQALEIAKEIYDYLEKAESTLAKLDPSRLRTANRQDENESSAE